LCAGCYIYFITWELSDVKAYFIAAVGVPAAVVVFRNTYHDVVFRNTYHDVAHAANTAAYRLLRTVVVKVVQLSVIFSKSRICYYPLLRVQYKNIII
jgi:hypothetical protein